MLEMGASTLGENLRLVNDVLRQQVALVAALLAAVVAFFGEDLMPKAAVIAVAGTLLLSLITAFFGVMPYEGDVDLHRPDDIRQHKADAYAFKRMMLMASGSLLMLALGGVLGGLLVG